MIQISRKIFFVGVLMGVSFSYLASHVKAHDEMEPKAETLRTLSLLRLTTIASNGDKKIIYKKSCVGGCVYTLAKIDWDAIHKDTELKNTKIKRVDITADPHTCDRLLKEFEIIDGLKTQVNIADEGQAVLTANNFKSEDWETFLNSMDNLNNSMLLNDHNGVTSVAITLER
ncbi:MAG: hypothetical protein JSS34_00420 [Proteobacteria bacterium]|nr:hypothetical protein [Pseudomonadota bacterium]